MRRQVLISKPKSLNVAFNNELRIQYTINSLL